MDTQLSPVRWCFAPWCQRPRIHIVLRTSANLRNLFKSTWNWPKLTSWATWDFFTFKIGCRFQWSHCRITVKTSTVIQRPASPFNILARSQRIKLCRTRGTVQTQSSRTGARLSSCNLFSLWVFLGNVAALYREMSINKYTVYMYISIYLSVYLSIYLSIYIYSIYLFICMCDI